MPDTMSVDDALGVLDTFGGKSEWEGVQVAENYQIPEKYRGKRFRNADGGAAVQDYLQARVRSDNALGMADDPDAAWGRVAQDVKRYFPEFDPAQVRPLYDKARVFIPQQDKLARAHEAFKDAEEKPSAYIHRHSIPIASAMQRKNLLDNYREAMGRFQEGKATDQDINDIAAFERLRESDESRGLGGQLQDAIAGIPAVVGEAYIGGKVLKAASFIPGMGWAAPAVAEGAVAPLTLRGAAAATPGYLGRTAAMTAAMPSMYLEDAARRALEHGGQPSDLKNLAPAMTHGAINTAILGTLSKVGNFEGPGLATALKKYSTKAGIGIYEQQIADLLAGGVGLTTDYGVVGDILKGRFGESLNRATVQAVTFAAFAALHGQDHKPVMDAYQQALHEMQKRGLSAEGAGKRLASVYGTLSEALDANPNLSPAEARKLVDGFPDQVARKLGRALADAIQKPAEAEGPPTTQAERVKARRPVTPEPTPEKPATPEAVPPAAVQETASPPIEQPGRDTATSAPEPPKREFLDVRHLIGPGTSKEKAVGDAVASHLAAGGKVSLWLDGEESPIVRVDRDRLIDNHGVPRSMLFLGLGQHNTKYGIELHKIDRATVDRSGPGKPTSDLDVITEPTKEEIDAEVRRMMSGQSRQPTERRPMEKGEATAWMPEAEFEAEIARLMGRKSPVETKPVQDAPEAPRVEADSPVVESPPVAPEAKPEALPTRPLESADPYPLQDPIEPRPVTPFKLPPLEERVGKILERESKGRKKYLESVIDALRKNDPVLADISTHPETGKPNYAMVFDHLRSVARGVEHGGGGQRRDDGGLRRGSSLHIGEEQILQAMAAVPIERGRLTLQELYALLSAMPESATGGVNKKNPLRVPADAASRISATRAAIASKKPAVESPGNEIRGLAPDVPVEKVKPLKPVADRLADIERWEESKPGLPFVDLLIQSLRNIDSWGASGSGMSDPKDRTVRRPSLEGVPDRVIFQHLKDLAEGRTKSAVLGVKEHVFLSPDQVDQALFAIRGHGVLKLKELYKLLPHMDYHEPSRAEARQQMPAGTKLPQRLPRNAAELLGGATTGREAAKTDPAPPAAPEAKPELAGADLESLFKERGVTVPEKKVLLARAEGKSFPEIGHEMGLSKQRIQQIEKAGLKKIPEIKESLEKTVVEQSKHDALIDAIANQEERGAGRGSVAMRELSGQFDQATGERLAKKSKSRADEKAMRMIELERLQDQWMKEKESGTLTPERSAEFESEIGRLLQGGEAKTPEAEGQPAEVPPGDSAKPEAKKGRRKAATGDDVSLMAGGDTTPAGEAVANPMRRSPQHTALAEKLSKDLAGSKIPEPQQREYMRSLLSVVGRMTPEAAQRAGDAMARASFFPSTIDLGLELAKTSPKARATLARGVEIGGVFRMDSGEMWLDGPSRFAEAHEVAAHELGHAIDGGISKSPEWLRASERELAGGEIGEYAATSPREAFAEFARLIYGQGVSPESLRKNFPLSAEVFDKHGLLGEGKQEFKKTPDVFQESINDGPVHADVLKTKKPGELKPETERTLRKYVQDFAADQGGYLDVGKLKERADRLYETVSNGVRHVGDAMRKMAGEMFPAIARLGRTAADAVARFVATRGYVQEATPYWIDRVMGKKAAPEERHLWGTAFQEMRHRHAFDAFMGKAEGLYREAAEARARGDTKAADAAEAKAKEFVDKGGAVATFIGHEGSPLKTEADYEAVLANPDFKAMLERYRKEFVPIMEENYRKAKGMDVEDPIDSLTQIPGLPMNARAIRTTEDATPGTVFVGGRGNLKNPRQGKLGFAETASLSHTSYDTDLGAIIENSLYQGSKAARKAEMYRELVNGGVAEWDKPGRPREGYKELPGVNPAKGTQSAGEGETSLYVKDDAYQEVRQALQVDQKPYMPILQQLGKASTWGALWSTMEVVYHTRNNLTMMFKPGMRPWDLFKTFWKVASGDEATMKRVVDLASIGAMHSGHEANRMKSNWNPTKWTGAFLEALGKSMRLMADDAFNRIKKAGYNIDTSESARRDFINQLGQYNKAAQGPFVAWFRDTGVGPFATAGTNYAMQGLRSLVMNPGIRTNSWKTEAALRGQYALRIGGAFAGAAFLNYVMWGRVDGNEDTPIGAVYLGPGRDGKSRYFDIGSFTGVPRGARLTGLMALAEGIRHDETPSQIADKGFGQAWKSALHPFAGPLVAFANTAATGKDSLGNQVATRVSTATTPEGRAKARREGRLEAGSSQSWENIKAALWHSIPLASVAFGHHKRGGEDATLTERALDSLGPFSPKERGQPVKKPRR